MNVPRVIKKNINSSSSSMGVARIHVCFLLLFLFCRFNPSFYRLLFFLGCCSHGVIGLCFSSRYGLAAYVLYSYVRVRRADPLAIVNRCTPEPAIECLSSSHSLFHKMPTNEKKFAVCVSIHVNLNITTALFIVMAPVTIGAWDRIRRP